MLDYFSNQLINKKMNLEGKVMGYDKKIVAIVVAVILAFVIFYAGTRYEKMRIISAQQKSAAQNTEPKKGKSAKTPIETPAGAVEASPATVQAAPAAPTTTAPVATPKPAAIAKPAAVPAK